MKIKVGSTNEVKIGAVREALALYSGFANAEVLGVAAASLVSDQPKSLEETMQGAMNRAKGAFADCEYSFGIESGLMRVPNTKTGFMDFTVCAVYDGADFYFGLSPAIEVPAHVMRFVTEEGMNLNEAFFKAGLTDNPTLGNAEGMLGLLTRGRVTRKDYTKQAIIMAMVHLEKY